MADLGQGRQIIRVKNCSGWTDPQVKINFMVDKKLSNTNVQWMGSWSPDATNWANVSEATRRELDGEAFHDGGFWIGFQDFLKYFDTIDFCHINTDVDREVVFNGRWEVGLNAGGVQKGDWANYARNPQCFIKLRSPNRSRGRTRIINSLELITREDPEGLCSAVISLMQRRQPSSKVKGVNKVGFRVYQVQSMDPQFVCYKTFLRCKKRQ